MSQELLINVTPRETRVIRVENGHLQEVVIERTEDRSCVVGNIYKGRVSRVLPGMQAAFVDIGLEKAGFLHLNEVIDSSRQSGKVPSPKTVSIREVLRESQILLVQVIKEPLGTKGVKLTTILQIPSRYLVLLPYSPGVIVIAKHIASAERQRLTQIAWQQLGIAETRVDSTATDKLFVTRSLSATPNYGFRIRTAAEGVPEHLLSADMAFLTQLWKDIKQKELYAATPALIYQDLPLALRTIRDLTGTSTEKVKIDSRATFQAVKEFAQKFIPAAVPLLEHYQGEQPLSELYAIDQTLTEALKRTVALQSGGSLVIDQTEAMTTIDVNTGTYVGSRHLEETAFQTNLQAATAIAHQVCLRNLGGLIIVDFIDMSEPAHQREVLRTLANGLKHDDAKTVISEVSPLGLVQMTRRRTRESLAQQLCETCPTCGGRGSIKTAETVCYEIFRALIRDAKRYETQQLLVQASPVVVERMSKLESATIAELEALTGCTIRFQVDNACHREHYRIIPSPL